MWHVQCMCSACSSRHAARLGALYRVADPDAHHTAALRVGHQSPGSEHAGRLGERRQHVGRGQAAVKVYDARQHLRRMGRVVEMKGAEVRSELSVR